MEAKVDAEVDAVVFDFFGTLTVQPSRAERRGEVARLAAVLGVDADDFAEAMAESFYQRVTGSWGDMPATLERVARQSGGHPTPAQVDEACGLRWEIETGFIRVREEVPDVLEALTTAGVTLGLISDCTHELPALWGSLPIAGYFAAATFSVTVGCHKPDPAMYLATADELGVDPRHCLYVGDGGSNELTGAAAVGMTPVMLCAPDHEAGFVYRREVGWEGPVVRSLTELPALFDALPT